MTTSPRRFAGKQAAELAAYGLALFLLPPGARVPAGPATPTSDPDQIRRMWQEAPHANVGVACRPSGIVVLDLDGETGRRSWQAACALQGRTPDPDTFTVATPSGGRHLYYQAPTGQVIPSTSGGRTRLGQGIDTRAPGARTGGYVLGPGSIVSGRPYTILTDRPPAPLPGWIAQAITRPRIPR